MTFLLLGKIFFIGLLVLLYEGNSDAYPSEPYNGLNGESQHYQEVLEFEDSQHQMNDGDSFVLINDNRRVNFNYKNDVSEVYLDGTSAGGRERPTYQYDHVDHIVEGPEPTFEREDIDGEDVEALLETDNVHLMQPFNGRVPSGIEYDVDGLDYVAHDPRDLETVAHDQRHGDGSPSVENAEMEDNHFEDSWET